MIGLRINLNTGYKQNEFLTVRPFPRRFLPRPRATRIPRRRNDPNPTSETSICSTIIAPSITRKYPVENRLFRALRIYLKMYGCTDLVSIFVEVSLRCERIPLLVVEVLLQVEERIKEDGGHAAPLQVAHGYSVGILGYDHVQHLEGEIHSV